MAIKRLQLRRDTAANWTSANPVLLAGELGAETDTGKFKVGDGSAAWASLAYSSGPAGTAGTAATVAVGTVTTLSAGSSATVTNGGSSAAATLNFGIPAGATGTGLTTGGTTGQVLKKNSSTNYDSTWVDQSTLVAGDTAKVNGTYVYIQTSDPGAVGAGRIWIQTV